MKILLFSRKAKILAREIIRGWYMKTLSADQIIRCAGGSFTWIGANPEEYCLFPAQKENAADLQRRQDSLPALTVEDDTWHFTPLGQNDALICGCCRLRTAPGSGLVLSEQPRITLLFHAEGDCIRLRHLHISFAAEPRKPPSRASPEKGGSYEYMGELAVQEQGKAFPELTPRQKKVLYYLTRGLTYRKIADILQITPRTVRYHIIEAERRLHAENRIQLIDLAFRRIRAFRNNARSPVHKHGAPDIPEK